MRQRNRAAVRRALTRYSGPSADGQGVRAFSLFAHWQTFRDMVETVDHTFGSWALAPRQGINSPASRVTEPLE